MPINLFSVLFEFITLIVVFQDVKIYKNHIRFFLSFRKNLIKGEKDKSKKFFDQ